MFKRIVIALATVAALTGAANAENLAGQKMAAGTEGQPICTESLEELREFMVAAMTGDTVHLNAILREGKCAMLKRGTAIAVLEDLSSEHDEIHPVKIRAMNSRGSVVGYSLNVGMVARK